MNLPFEQFPALSVIGICRHAFAQRIPGIAVSQDKVGVLKRLDAEHVGLPNAIKQRSDRFGSDSANIIVQLSPCIRPPNYEVDFAAEIVSQCRELGVKEIHDSGVCTACDLDRYYSYRAEKGKTGRMLALLGLNPTIAN